MRVILLWILGFIAVWPIHFTIVRVGEKPMDLILSDLLFFIVPLAWAFFRSQAGQVPLKPAQPSAGWYRLTPCLALICIGYMATLAAIGTIQSGETIRLFSALKLAKPIGFVFLGLMVGSCTDPVEFIHVFSRAHGLVVALTLFFTAINPNVPTSGWGKYLFEFELSGYPNSPMSFYAALVPLLLAAADATRKKSLKLLGWGLATGSALMIVGSMSRSSTLALFFGTSLYLVATGRRAVLAAIAAVFMILCVIGLGFAAVKSPPSTNHSETPKADHQTEKSDEPYDPTNGRLEIWQFAAEMAAERPVFGYMFEPFSRHTGNIDGPHQQYLEILYKCGGVGLVLYLALLGSCVMATGRLIRMSRKGTVAWFQLRAMCGMLLGVLLGNLTQPNLTYSLTGNMVFLLFGSLCSARAAMSVSQPLQPGKGEAADVPTNLPVRIAA